MTPDRRATLRYALSMPIRIHLTETDPVSSRAGKTLNVSTRGVQFTSELGIPPGTELEFTITLQAELGGPSDAFIHGSGRVARVLECGERQFQVSVAVTRFQISREKSIHDALPVPKKSTVAAEWTLAGTYFEACNCDVACPCTFLSPPTTGECTSLIGWHVEKGSYGGTILDGLNVAIAVHSPGQMAQVKWNAAVYIDDRSTAAQKDALATIFSGQAGGHTTVFAAQIGELRGVKSVPIEYRAEGKRRSLRIPGVAAAEIEGLSGQDGNPVTIANLPFCVAVGIPAEVAKSKHMSFSDYGQEWNVTEKNGFFSRFQYKN
jgi:hypothetical protein